MRHGAVTRTRPLVKPTLKNVANLAGVSVATVDRTLNGRGGVRRELVAQVLEAARTLRIDRDLDRIPKETLRFAILMTRTDRDVYARVQKAIQAYQVIHADKGFACSFLFYSGQTPSAIATRIEAAQRGFDGAIVVAYDHPRVTEAINRLCERMPVVTLISDLPHSKRLCYVGSGNRKAGRVAGDFMGRLIQKKKAKILTITRLQRYTAHHDREAAFHKAVAERFPGFSTEHVLECNTGNMADKIVAQDYIDRHGPFDGLYNISSWNIGVVKDLKTLGFLAGMVTVAHGLNRQIYEMLCQESLDVVIEYAPEDYACSAVDALLKHHGRSEPLDIERQHHLEIFTRENLPPSIDAADRYLQISV